MNDWSPPCGRLARPCKCSRWKLCFGKKEFITAVRSRARLWLSFNAHGAFIPQTDKGLFGTRATSLLCLIVDSCLGISKTRFLLCCVESKIMEVDYLPGQRCLLTFKIFVVVIHQVMSIYLCGHCSLLHHNTFPMLSSKPWLFQNISICNVWPKYSHQLYEVLERERKYENSGVQLVCLAALDLDNAGTPDCWPAMARWEERPQCFVCMGLPVLAVSRPRWKISMHKRYSRTGKSEKIESSADLLLLDFDMHTQNEICNDARRNAVFHNAFRALLFKRFQFNWHDYVLALSLLLLLLLLFLYTYVRVERWGALVKQA